MRQFRARPRPDTVVNEVRRQRIVWTRALYLTMLAGLVLWLLDFLFGPYLYLTSEGMVVAPHATIATEFPATVRTVIVRRGERVTAGELLVMVSSQKVAETVARLTSELARLHAQEATLRIQIEKNGALVHLASARSTVANQIRRRYETLERDGVLPSDKRLAAIDDEYRSRADLETLKTELAAMHAQLKQLTPAIGEAEIALHELRTQYGRGDIVSPINGIVSQRNVDAGTVVAPGEPMMEIYGHDVYVLAYLPVGTLYSVKPGQSVTIEWGTKHVPGHITAIEPVAVALPREFQTAFKPVARSQVLRIRFDGRPNRPDDPRGENGLPPLFTKVEVHGRMAHMFEQMIEIHVVRIFEKIF